MVYEAVEESFADHWDHVRGSYDEWAAFLMDGSFEPLVWFLAVDGGEIAGFSLCRERQPGRPDTGWVRQLGVRRPWRRRGLALALLLHSFGELHRRGRTSVGLGVDGENTTGAVRLYERAGMHVERRFDTYERRLR